LANYGVTYKRTRWLFLAVWALAALSGCGLRMFFQMKEQVLDEHLRLFLGGWGNSTALLHGGEAFLVDVKTGDEAMRLREVLEVQLAREVRRIMITHAHFDHAGALDLYPSAGAVLVHPNTRARLERDGVRAAFTEVNDLVQLSLGGEVVQVRYLGKGHTDGDLVAFFPKRKLLVAGDLFFDGFEPFADETYGGDLLSLRLALEHALTLDFDDVVSGHGAVKKKADVKLTVEYLNAMEEAVRASVAAGRGEDETVKQVTLPAYPRLPRLPTRFDREQNVRAMYRLLTAR
jgi:glyoxylase-like metal-dependent hydrolase (beta-lactamase superfamily II)